MPAKPTQSQNCGDISSSVARKASPIATVPSGQQQRRTPAEEADTIIHGLVPIIAACSYFAMATGQGSILPASGPAGRRMLPWPVAIAKYEQAAMIGTRPWMFPCRLAAVRSGPLRWGWLFEQRTN
jgi:hypothetical protein